MDLITRERDRLLRRTARLFGLSYTLISAVCLALPGAVPGDVLVLCIPLYLALVAFQYLLGRGRPALWSAFAIAAGLAIVAVVTILAPDPNPSTLSAITQLSAGSLAACATVLTSTRWRLVVLCVGFPLVVGATSFLTAELQDPVRTGGLIVMGWVVAALVGVWVSLAVPRAVKRIARIGRAHRAERQASELEAQRRQGARLLHDTVLATLTLLAHSGVGVSPAALREQAGDDAKLLRQLRLGGNPMPSAAVATAPGAVGAANDAVLGTTLESVKQRFGRMGLQVNWHGTGQVLLPSDVLDAFLLSLAECLENVRRHSGVTEAHVTITEDEATVRALVTDSGVGFSLEGIDENRLGFKESVIGRLAEVGGSARLFSSPGQGTTVVLEVPR